VTFSLLYEHDFKTSWTGLKELTINTQSKMTVHFFITVKSDAQLNVLDMFLLCLPSLTKKNRKKKRHFCYEFKVE